MTRWGKSYKMCTLTPSLASRNAHSLTLYPLHAGRIWNTHVVTLGWIGGWMDGWMDEWMDERIDGWMDEWMDERIDGWLDEWMNERMDEWVNEWKDGWKGGWTFQDKKKNMILTFGAFLSTAWKSWTGADDENKEIIKNYKIIFFQLPLTWTSDSE